MEGASAIPANGFAFDEPPDVDIAVGCEVRLVDANGLDDEAEEVGGCWDWETFSGTDGFGADEVAAPDPPLPPPNFRLLKLL